MYIAVISYLPDGLLGTLLQRWRPAPSGAGPLHGLAPPPDHGEKLKINQGGIE
jgi:hypothetical protein